MINTDVLPFRVRGVAGRTSRSARAELWVSAREDTDLDLLQPISLAIRDLLAERAEDKREIHLLMVNRTRQVTIASDLAVATNSGARRRGLLGRNELPHGAGLWISPCESVHTIGMRFPIDLVYLDRENRVRKIRHHVRPWRISACFSAHSVIELPAGTNHATGTREGDVMEFCCAVPVG